MRRAWGAPLVVARGRLGRMVILGSLRPPRGGIGRRWRWVSEIALMICRGERRVRWLIVVGSARWVRIIGIVSGIVRELVLHVGGGVGGSAA